MLVFGEPLFIQYVNLLIQSIDNWQNNYKLPYEFSLTVCIFSYINIVILRISAGKERSILVTAPHTQAKPGTARLYLLYLIISN